MRVVGPCESGTEVVRVQARATSRQDQPCPGAVTVSPATVMVESVDDAEGLYVAVERCPLCNTARRRLTCARCIRAGDFVYFDGKNPERYVLLITFCSFTFSNNKTTSRKQHIFVAVSQNPVGLLLSYVALTLASSLCKQYHLLAHANDRAKQQRRL